jgi:LysR family transcriptional regulator of gallate degradation
MFGDRGLEPPRLRIECGSVLVVRGLMLEDDWLTLMSRDQFLFEARAGLLGEIPGAGESLRRHIGLTTREDWRPTRLQTAFLDTFRAVCTEWTSGKAMDRGPFRYA